MSRVLQINRSTYYYEAKQRPDESPLCETIVDIFRTSRNNYGTRKIKVKFQAQGVTVSRRRIGRIMKENGLVSNHTTAQYHPKKDTCNEADIENIVNRTFSH